jgi:hypothetical protein
MSTEKRRLRVLPDSLPASYNLETRKFSCFEISHSESEPHSLETTRLYKRFAICSKFTKNPEKPLRKPVAIASLTLVLFSDDMIDTWIDVKDFIQVITKNILSIITRTFNWIEPGY